MVLALSNTYNSSIFHFDISFNLSDGKVHDVSGEVQNNLRGGATPLPPQIWPCPIEAGL
jgi:hypothetical protein